MTNLQILSMQVADLNKEGFENLKHIIFIRHGEKVCSAAQHGPVGVHHGPGLKAAYASLFLSKNLTQTLLLRVCALTRTVPCARAVNALQDGTCSSESC